MIQHPWRPLSGWPRGGLASLVLVAVAVGCASGGAALPGEPRHDLITENLILASGASDPYELIRKLRPSWIARGGNDTPQNPGKIFVLLDGMRMGGIESLRMIPMAGIAYIRWYHGLEAASRWGLDHERGVIYISTEPLRR